MTVPEAVSRASVEALRSRQRLLEAGLELLLARIEELERHTLPQDVFNTDCDVVRLPKFKLRDINARLEGEDIA